MLKLMYNWSGLVTHVTSCDFNWSIGMGENYLCLFVFGFESEFCNSGGKEWMHDYRSHNNKTTRKLGNVAIVMDKKLIDRTQQP